MASFNNNLSRVIAHRGASADAPENTLSALNLAIQYGAGCVEVDAMISSDGVAFLHHDDGLERCTTGSGYFCAATAAELDALDASGKHDGFTGEPIPRLSAALELLIAKNTGLNLEIKPTPGLEQPTAAAVVAELKAMWPTHLPLIISSFSKDALEVVQDLMPEAPRALITCAVPPDWESALAKFGCTNFHMAADLLSAADAKAIKAAGYGLYCYTVNDVSQAQHLLNLGVDGVFTDKPKQLLSELSA